MNNYTLELLEEQYFHENGVSLDKLLNSEIGDNTELSEIYLRQALSFMRKSHIAELLLQYCAKSGVNIRFDTLLLNEQSIFYEDKNILDIPAQNHIFNEDIYKRRMSELIIALAYGLRKAWHYNRGNIFNPELAVKDLLHLCRSAEADAVVFTTLICWELKEKGNSNPWRQWLIGDNADVAIAFEKTQAENGSAKNMYGLRRALEESYCQWFRNDARGAASEHMALEKLDRILMKYKNKDMDISWIGKKNLSALQWKKIGDIPGLKNYLERENLLQHGYKKQPSDVFNRVHFQHLLRDISKN